MPFSLKMTLLFSKDGLTQIFAPKNQQSPESNNLPKKQNPKVKSLSTFGAGDGSTAHFTEFIGCHLCKKDCQLTQINFCVYM